MRRRVFALLPVVVVVLALACGSTSGQTPPSDDLVALSVQQTQTAAAVATTLAGPPPTVAVPPSETPLGASPAPTNTEAPSPSPSPSPSATLPEGPTSTPGAGPVAGPTSGTPGLPGKITGALSYPSEAIPRLKVYAWDRGSGLWRYIITNPNQDSYELEVVPGKYIVFAYLNEGGDLAAGYTNAVLCGLTAACADHTLYEVTVGSGQQVSGVNVTDWYGPPGFVPKAPG